MGVDTVLLSPPPAPAPDRLSRLRSPRTLAVAVGIALTMAVALRFLATSVLWLDEAQTVDIAHRSLPDLFAALRHDGSPPVYYLLLHGWMDAFGAGTFAVRALSGLLSVAALPVAWLAAYRLTGNRRVGWTATLLLASCPFAVRYATEARMYALVVLLGLLTVLAVHGVWTTDRWAPRVGLAVLVALLVLTHYWCLFAVAVLGAGALVAALRGSRPARSVLVCTVVGCLAFLPWLPSFLYQSAHTGAPWGRPPTPQTALWVLSGWAGGGLTGALLAFAYYALVALAVAGRPGSPGVRLTLPLRRLPTLLLGFTLAAMLLGCITSAIQGSAYAIRYSSVALPTFVLGAALGIGTLPRRWRDPAVAVLVVLGISVAAFYPGQSRSQAGEVAAALRADARPGDVVVFCPDQLGPAVHRLAPDAGRQVVFPTFGDPQMVDWVDYAVRNEVADPQAFAERTLAMAGDHTVYLVYAGGYPTFGDDCAELYAALQHARGEPEVGVRLHGGTLEHERLAAFPPTG